MICKASGVEFIPATKLREIYPEAVRSSAGQKEDELAMTPQLEEKAEVVDVASDTAAADVDDGNTVKDGESSKAMAVSGTEAGDVKADDEKDEEWEGSKAAVSGKLSRKGTEVSLVRLRLCDGAGTLVAARISLIVACGRCVDHQELSLVSGQLYTVTCSRCHSQQLVQFNTDIAHSMSTIIGFLNVEGCQPVDLVLTTSHFLVGCTTCSKEATVDVSVSV